MTSEYVDARWWARAIDGVQVTTHRNRWRTAIVVCGVVAISALVLAEFIGSPEIAFGGLMALAVGAGPIVAILRGRGDDPLAHPTAWVAGGLVIGTFGLFLLLVGAPGALGAAITVIGIFGYGRGLEHHCRRDLSGGLTGLVRLFPGRCGREPVIVGLAGLVVLGAASVFEIGWLALLGGWLMLLSMMAIGAARNRLRIGDVAEIGALVVGVLLVALAGWFTWTTGVAGDSQAFLVFIVLTVAGAGATLIWRLETIFVAVILGFMFVWGLAPFTVSDDRSVNGPGGDRTAHVVAFGDSYISGEGAARFFDGTDQKGDDRNECRRAPTAYPALLSEATTDVDSPFHVTGLGDGLDFLACSGAKVRQVVDIDVPGDPDDDARRAVERRADLPCDPPDDRLAAQYPCGPEEVYGSRLQIDHLATERSDTQLVLLSIGGNDARFGEVVTGCLLPGSCAERREIWLDRVGALGIDLQAAYEVIRDAFNPAGSNEVPIVVMPYPLVMTETSCAASPLLAVEHEFVTEFTTVLNQQIEAATRRAGVHFFADGVFSFEGHRVCETDRPAINLIKLQPTDGPLGDRLDPGSWTHNSMHPSEFGHELIATRLAAWLDADEILTAAPANPEPDPTASSEVLDLRAARPFAIGPDTVADLTADPPAGPNCRFDAIDGFATRIEVFDELGLDDTTTRVPVVGADPTATICSTDSNGHWQFTRPDATPETATDDAGDGERSILSIEADGGVFIRGGRPGGDCSSTDRSVFCDFQWVRFSTPPEPLPDGSTGPREWQLRALNYCTVDPDCPDSIGEWTSDQLATARREVAPAVGLVLIGGWLTALGLALNRKRLTAAVLAVTGRRTA